MVSVILQDDVSRNQCIRKGTMMSYKIGSFNVRNLSYGAAASRDLDLIAEIIKEFDIVALQEVLSEGKILQGPSIKDVAGQAKAYEYSLKSRLGDNWDMCWLDPQTDSKWYPYLGDSRGEGYAFLWRKNKFQCPKNARGEEVRPRVFRQYRTDKKQGELKLMRDPAYGRFQLVNMPNAEIRLISTHIMFEKPKEMNLPIAIEAGSIVMRRNEFNVLARSIYTSICDDRNDINCVVPYTIMLGDYNLNLLESGVGNPIVPDVVVIDSQKNIVGASERATVGSEYVMHTKQALPTTISRNGEGYASNYDHFTYEQRRAEHVVRGNPYRVDVVDRAGGFGDYKKRVSDHIPIMLEIDLR